jgi:hypothetical protein
MKDASQEELAKVYLGIWLVNRELFTAFRAGNPAITATMLVNSALPAQNVWKMLDHETRTATRKRIRMEFGGHWKTINPLDDEWWAARGSVQ